MRNNLQDKFQKCRLPVLSFSICFVLVCVVHNARGTDLDQVTNEKPKVDLDILFDINSAIISPKVKPSVNALGTALSNPDLKGSTFVIAGHTDSLEDEAYSQRLSERRAEAVKYYLVRYFNIPGSDLVTVGYGSTKLKSHINPFNSRNNRVQIVNMETRATK